MKFGQTARNSSGWFMHFAQSIQKKEMNTIRKQKFDYFLVLDFEATCDSSPIAPQEIIEFPCLKVSAKTFKVESQFHQYVRPIHRPILTQFCTQLTGITQEMVAHEDPFPEVWESFHSWMRSEQIFSSSFAFVICGDWDFKTMLPKQLQTSNLDPHSGFKQWINIKKSYFKVMKTFPRHMDAMLKGLGLKFEGRPHSGIDDTKNITRIVQNLALKGHVFELTSKIG